MTLATPPRAALVVDGDVSVQSPLVELLAERGYQVSLAATLESARHALAGEGEFELVLTSLELPDGTGKEVIARLAEKPGRHVGVVLTEEERVTGAVEAMRLGAVDYVTKPIRAEAVRATLTRVERHLNEVDEQRALRRELARHGTYLGLVGRSPVMKSVFELVERAGTSRIRVFIRGESGTGKELLARAVHQVSPRRTRPFVPVNCGAVPASLAESEFFGHERGSFTGAAARHEGYFEQAHGGTLFLDEVAEMPLDLQVRLLRVVEDGVIRRVGGTKDIPVDVRIVSATNRDPEADVACGRFRSDLYYRLHVFPISLPPLRQRRSDIMPIAHHLMEQVADAEGGASVPFTEHAAELMTRHDWPGNVRELRNVISMAWLLANGEPITAAHLPAFINDPRPSSAARAPEAEAPEPSEPTPRPAPSEPSRVDSMPGELTVPYGITLEEVEKRFTLGTLEFFGGHRERTATALGVTSRTLYTKCQTWGVSPPRARAHTCTPPTGESS